MTTWVPLGLKPLAELPFGYNFDFAADFSRRHFPKSQNASRVEFFIKKWTETSSAFKKHRKLAERHTITVDAENAWRFLKHHCSFLSFRLFTLKNESQNVKLSKNWAEWWINFTKRQRSAFLSSVLEHSFHVRCRHQNCNIYLIWMRSIYVALQTTRDQQNVLFAAHLENKTKHIHQTQKNG